MAEGFSSYTTTTKVTGNVTGVLRPSFSFSNGQYDRLNIEQTEAVLALVKDGADIILAERGNLVQSILVDEGVAAFSAHAKDTLRRVLLDEPNRVLSAIPLNLGRLFPPPPEQEIEPFLRKTEEETRAQKLLTRIGTLRRPPPELPATRNAKVTSNSGLEGATEFNAEQLAMIAKELRLNFPKYAPLVGRLGGKVSSHVICSGILICFSISRIVELRKTFPLLAYCPISIRLISLPSFLSFLQLS